MGNNLVPHLRGLWGFIKSSERYPVTFLSQKATAEFEHKRQLTDKCRILPQIDYNKLIIKDIIGTFRVE